MSESLLLLNLKRSDLDLDLPRQPLISQVMEYLHSLLVVNVSLLEIVLREVNVGNCSMLLSNLEAILSVYSFLFFLSYRIITKIS